MNFHQYIFKAIFKTSVVLWLAQKIQTCWWCVILGDTIVSVFGVIAVVPCTLYLGFKAKSPAACPVRRYIDVASRIVSSFPEVISSTLNANENQVNHDPRAVLPFCSLEEPNCCVVFSPVYCGLLKQRHSQPRSANRSHFHGVDEWDVGQVDRKSPVRKFGWWWITVQTSGVVFAVLHWPFRLGNN